MVSRKIEIQVVKKCIDQGIMVTLLRAPFSSSRNTVKRNNIPSSSNKDSTGSLAPNNMFKVSKGVMLQLSKEVSGLSLVFWVIPIPLNCQPHPIKKDIFFSQMMHSMFSLVGLTRLHLLLFYRLSDRLVLCSI